MRGGHGRNTGYFPAYLASAVQSALSKEVSVVESDGSAGSGSDGGGVGAASVDWIGGGGGGGGAATLKPALALARCSGGAESMSKSPRLSP
jgi:hypothetical protein